MSLPVDAILEDVHAAVAARRNVVVEAAPGAGKTTRIPAHLLERGSVGEGEILVLQPRRIAARAAASFVAARLGEAVGERCGYRVRFESKTSARTKLCFITEALLLRRLRGDPGLMGVGAVVFDEFHERHIAGDVGLALVRRLQRERGDAAPLILAMSATLDAEPVARFLEADRLRSEGRAFPVEIRHAPEPRRGERSRPPQLEERVRRALRAVLADDPGGHVLVFLPGAGEIRRCRDACAEIAAQAGLVPAALHGGLSSAEQDAVLRDDGRRKLVLATNIAETSLTIDGVKAVIDSGLARVARDDPWSGLPTLELAKTSRASAAQRAGRAGRTAPGLCLRLFTEHDHDQRPAFTPPEIVRLDLTDALLDLQASGIRDPHRLDWLEPPPPAALERGLALLSRLGASSAADGALTPTGRAMLPLPVHPRHARLLVEAKRRGIALEGATAVALLTERPLTRRGAGDASLDLEDELDDFARAARRGRAAGVDANALRRVTRLREQLVRALRRVEVADAIAPPRGEATANALPLATLAGYPDHVARVRRGEGGPAMAVFAGGGAAEMPGAANQAVGDWLVALAVERRRDGSGRETTRVHRHVEIEADWLLDLFPERIEEIDDLRFDAQREQVEGRSELRYEGLVLASSPKTPSGEEATELLRQAALSAGPEAFVEPEALASLLARTALLAGADPSFRELGADEARAALAELCEGRRSFAELRAADLLGHLRASLGARAGRLDGLAPAAIALPGRRRVPIHYETGKPPWIESRLQDFFGLREGPRIADGRIPLVLHLLAPNFRAVQVTTDLAGFWERHYPGLRKTLMRRYPRHAWPEDPLQARAP